MNRKGAEGAKERLIHEGSPSTTKQETKWQPQMDADKETALTTKAQRHKEEIHPRRATKHREETNQNVAPIRHCEESRQQRDDVAISNVVFLTYGKRPSHAKTPSRKGTNSKTAVRRWTPDPGRWTFIMSTKGH